MSSLICINACSLLLGKNIGSVSMISKKTMFFPWVLEEFAVRTSQWRIKSIFSLRHIASSNEVRGIIEFRFKLIHKWPLFLEPGLGTSSVSCETDFCIAPPFLSFVLNTIMLGLKVSLSTVLLTYGKRINNVGNS